MNIQTNVISNSVRIFSKQYIVPHSIIMSVIKCVPVFCGCLRYIYTMTTVSWLLNWIIVIRLYPLECHTAICCCCWLCPFDRIGGMLTVVSIQNVCVCVFFSADIFLFRTMRVNVCRQFNEWFKCAKYATEMFIWQATAIGSIDDKCFSCMYMLKIGMHRLMTVRLVRFDFYCFVRWKSANEHIILKQI